jgi:hypothetical protein
VVEIYQTSVNFYPTIGDHIPGDGTPSVSITFMQLQPTPKCIEVFYKNSTVAYFMKILSAVIEL